MHLNEMMFFPLNLKATSIKHKRGKVEFSSVDFTYSSLVAKNTVEDQNSTSKGDHLGPPSIPVTGIGFDAALTRIN